jgi:manganese/zinc/iron transport system permease protein
MMAVAAGGILLLAAAFSPRHGICVKFVRRHLLAWQILADDVVSLLYRIQERDHATSGDVASLRSILFTDAVSLNLILRWLRWRGQIVSIGNEYRLTDRGEEAAEQLVRSHRLWEQYLADHASVDADRLHDQAERFEHFTDRSLREQLSSATDQPSIDPHGTPIPAERSDD